MGFSLTKTNHFWGSPFIESPMWIWHATDRSIDLPLTCNSSSPSPKKFGTTHCPLAVWLGSLCYIMWAACVWKNHLLKDGWKCWNAKSCEWSPFAEISSDRSSPIDLRNVGDGAMGCSSLSLGSLAKNLAHSPRTLLVCCFNQPASTFIVDAFRCWTELSWKAQENSSNRKEAEFLSSKPRLDTVANHGFGWHDVIGSN